MDTKLTLKLNQEIIERAKVYASDKKNEFVPNCRILSSIFNNGQERFRFFDFSIC
ncbi:DUF6364 family protein [Gillisia marina]|uniref:DUF6364 family protein n=1 Tax=Gillisia marina TaxID=1167637 RepID=UPI00373FCD9A